MSTEKIEPTVNPMSGLPGSLLRQAREDKGLTIEEMSAISNLTKQVIRGIENDQYSELAGLSFVRGYLKLYAKKLGVDEAQVLEGFDHWKAEQTGGPRQAQPSNSRIKAAPTGPSRVTLIVAALTVAGLVVAGVVISYLDSSDQRLAITVTDEPLPTTEPADLKARIGETVIQSEKIAVADTADSPPAIGGYSAKQSAEDEPQKIEVTQPGDTLSKATTPEILSEATGPDIAEAEKEPFVSAAKKPEFEPKAEPQKRSTPVKKPKGIERLEPAAEKVRKEDKPVVVSSSNVVSSSVSPEVPAEPVPNAQNLSQSSRVIAEATGLAPLDDGLRVSTQAVTTPPSSDQLAMGARGRLEIDFSGESWVEVRDARGRLVLADLMTPDNGVDLQTYGPVEVLVGAVSVSDVTFNGETQNLETRAFQDVARITLGAETN